MWGRSLLQLLAEAGFVEGRIHGWTGYHTSSCTEGALISARKPARANRGRAPRHTRQIWYNLPRVTTPVPQAFTG